MAKKKRAGPQPAGHASPAGTPVASATAAGSFTILAILASLMLLAPGLGVPAEEMLQDTLKSMLVSVGTLAAAVLFFWQQRQRREPLRWHAIVWLPLVLMLYALGSMAWSHTFLAGAEAIRWFIFALLLWLGLNSLDRERAPWLAWGIHGGAVLASLWTALQFWADLRLFPQGPNPASTFVNRNFFAEFAICTLPFSAWLLLRSRHSARTALLAFSTGFNVVAILMTGTRSALLAMAALALAMPWLLWRCRGQLALLQGGRSLRLLAAGVLLATVAVLGNIPTGNAALREEQQANQRGSTALERSFLRTLSMAERKEYSEGSFSVRWVMWSATARMIQARPLTGVGAGAWEVDIPLYQAQGSQLETDYYVHNEPLQLLAEYGLAGWAFLAGLLAYVGHAAWRTWRMQGAGASAEAAAEAPARTIALCCLLALAVVSNAGFPWRMASTGALFALALAMLAASDARLGFSGAWQARVLRWKPAFSRLSLGGSAAALLLALYISQQAADCERYIVSGVRMSLAIANSPNPNDPRWAPAKAEMLALIERGIAINPHYRKLTPMAADNLARWGDWKNAIRIWDSVAGSRPYVVAILGNIARGHIQAREFDAARAYLARARAIQPRAPFVHAMEIMLLHQTGQHGDMLAQLKQDLQAGIYDYDMLTAAYVYGSEAGEWELALQGLQLLIKDWPDQALDAWLKTGRIYASPQHHDDAKALAAFRSALELATPEQRPAVLQHIPASYRSRF